ncbi:glycosyltransferase [Pseudomonadales bacterium]|nr:glycosyltransferase [Pseudomonadales bacterium]
MIPKSVSVVSANYNNAKYLHDYFESIMQSEVLPNEIIIVDDGSTDNSKEVIASASASNHLVKPIYLDTNVGFANALNIAIENVKSTYILRLDPDDCIDVNRISMQVEFLENNPTIGIVGSNVEYFTTRARKIIGKSNFQSGIDWIEDCYRSGDNGIMHGTVLGRTEHFRQYSYQQAWVPAEDYDVFSRMIVDGVLFANLLDSLTYVRVHEGSVTNDLRYDVFTKTFHLRGERFGLHKHPAMVFIGYLSRKCYRRYLASSNINKYVYLAIAATLAPSASFRRTRNFFWRFYRYASKNEH